MCQSPDISETSSTVRNELLYSMYLLIAQLKQRSSNNQGSHIFSHLKANLCSTKCIFCKSLCSCCCCFFFLEKSWEKIFSQKTPKWQKRQTEFISTSSLTLQENRIWPKNQNGGLLVSYHSHKKIWQTGWIEQQKFILHSSRGKFKVLSVRPLFLACRKLPFLLCPHIFPLCRCRERASSGDSSFSFKDKFHWISVPPLWPHNLVSLRAPLWIQSP